MIATNLRIVIDENADGKYLIPTTWSEYVEANRDGFTAEEFAEQYAGLIETGRYDANLGAGGTFSLLVEHASA